jgi:hypothetical protein
MIYGEQDAAEDEYSCHSKNDAIDIHDGEIICYDNGCQPAIVTISTSPGS